MAEYNDMIITRQGRDLINRQIIGEKSLEITKLAVGTGMYTGEESLEELEELLCPLEDYEIRSAERRAGAVEIKAVVTNRTFIKDALLTEIGVYATDGNTEILYGIATAACPMQLPAYNGNFEYSVDFSVYLTVNNGVGFTIRDRTDIATKQIAGVVKASEEIEVESDGTMRVTEKPKKEVLNKAKEFMEMKISDLIGGAPETLDTLKEIADAIAENETIVDALNEAIGKKVNIDDFNTQMTNLGKSVAEGKQLLAATLSGWGPNPVASDAAFEVLNSAINTTVGTYGDNRYNQGYVKGVQDADGRALPGSVNYQSGYNQGASDKHTELVNSQHNSLVSGSGAFGAWVAMWVMPNNKTDLHRYTNTGTWKTVYAGNQGDRRIVLGVGYGDINQCVSPASADLVAIWAI